MSVRAAHARRIRPAARPTRHANDRRRLAAAFLSALIPGLGQALNGQRRLAGWLLLPSLLLVVIALGALVLIPPIRLLAWVVSPGVLAVLLILNVVVMLARLVAVGQAYFDPRYPAKSERAGLVVLAVLVVFVVVPHLVAHQDGVAAQNAFGRIFEDGRDDRQTPGGITGPGATERVNFLLIGVDAAPQRTQALTDSMMVVSLDPIGKTVSIVSLPRDIVGTPLGNGDTFGPKLNSLRQYANLHPKEFPQGGTRALEDAIGALLGITIHYQATVDLKGFIKLVDLVGGVTVDNRTNLNDIKYDWLDGTFGFILKPGIHHLDGRHALAYVRSRYTPGDTDFGRAARQQEVLLAIRAEVVKGNVILRLPELFDAIAEMVATDVPVDRLPDFAAAAAEVAPSDIYRVVIGHPLVKGARTDYGSSQVPDLDAIRAVAAGLFGPPGVTPVPWPTPKPAATSKPTAAPKATAAP